MLKQKVIGAIAKVKEIAEAEITPESTLEELQVDSLDAIEVMFELEEEFDVSIPTENLRELRTVQDVIQGVAELIEESSAGATAEKPAEGGPPPRQGEDQSGLASA